MDVGSLFSGIGGFDLGFARAGFDIAWQVEIDEYCRKVLKKHWPDVPKYGDIKELTGKELAPVDVICGGFPCQDISVAGKGVGIHGSRSSLWFEMLRIIRVVRPRIVVVENVSALLRRGMGTVLGDLAESGYDCEWDCIPAGSFGAHFIGTRVFIVATSAPAGGLRWKRGWPPAVGTNQWGEHEFERLVRVEVEHGVPAGSFGRLSDGIPRRVDRLRALGNAIVPQVAEWIAQRISERRVR